MCKYIEIKHIQIDCIFSDDKGGTRTHLMTGIYQPSEKWNSNHYYHENDVHVHSVPVKWYSQHGRVEATKQLCCMHLKKNNNCDNKDTINGENNKSNDFLFSPFHFISFGFGSSNIGSNSLVTFNENYTVSIEQRVHMFCATTLYKHTYTE